MQVAMHGILAATQPNHQRQQQQPSPLLCDDDHLRARCLLVGPDLCCGRYSRCCCCCGGRQCCCFVDEWRAHFVARARECDSVCARYLPLLPPMCLCCVCVCAFSRFGRAGRNRKRAMRTKTDIRNMLVFIGSV